MKPYPNRSIKNLSGFSMVELMVGMAIAMIASLAIMQVLTSFETNKRSTTAGSEAQENGLIALSQLETEIHNAGAGISDPTLFGCTTMYTYLASAGGPIPNFSLAPISITDGASNASDTLTIQVGANLLSGIPAQITAAMPPSSAEFNVNNPGLFTPGTFDVVVDPATGNCTFQNVTTVQTASKKIQHNPGNSGPNNPPNNYQNANNWPGYPSGSKVMSVGAMKARTYSIVNNSLQMVELDVTSQVANAALVLGKDIVNMQAQYGIANAGSQVVNAWVNPTGATWAAPTPANIARIKAIRLVLVARSGKMETTNVTGTCVNNAGTNNGPCAWQDSSANPAPFIDLSSDSNWRKYRYKVYQTIIPLRNVIWAGV